MVMISINSSRTGQIKHKLMNAGVAFVLLVMPFISTAASLNTAHWEEDLRVYANELRARHINLFHQISEEDFSAHLQKIKHALPHLDRWQVIIELMRLTRRVGDGHTAVPLWGESSLMLPVKFEPVAAKYIVTAASPTFSGLLGMELTAINNTGINELNSTLSALVPFVENENSATVRIAHALSNVSILMGIGAIPSQSSIELTLLNLQGNRKRVTLPVRDKPAYEKIVWQELGESFPLDYFTHLQHLSINETIDVGFDSKSKTAYLSIKTYPSFEDMLLFSETLTRFLQEQASRHIIIDLRDSYGGDLYMGMLLASFLNQLDSVAWEEGVFVLTSKKTFSAAMVNARQFWRLLNAQIYGQPTGARPNGYQDMGSFTLPHSGLLITYSKRRFRIEDEVNNAVTPDRLINPTLQDIINGHDRVIDAVMTKINLQTKRREHATITQ